jgi:hypothetical protein
MKMGIPSERRRVASTHSPARASPADAKDLLFPRDVLEQTAEVGVGALPREQAEDQKRFAID